jgi:glutamate dehydrogenase
VTTLDARAITVLRAYTRYFKQLGFAFQPGLYRGHAQQKRRHCTGHLRLFMARFDPALAVAKRCNRMPNGIPASMPPGARSPAWTKTASCASSMPPCRPRCAPTCGRPTPTGGQALPGLKLNPREVPGVPEPKPLFEIWVYSPRVEGVHLRGGKVARGACAGRTGAKTSAPKSWAWSRRSRSRTP